MKHSLYTRPILAILLHGRSVAGANNTDRQLSHTATEHRFRLQLPIPDFHVSPSIQGQRKWNQKVNLIFLCPCSLPAKALQVLSSRLISTLRIGLEF